MERRESLKDYGWLSHAVERVFALLRYPSEFLMGLGSGFRDSFKNPREAEKARSQRIETYLAISILIDLFLLFIVSSGMVSYPALSWLIRGVAGFQIVDIVQVAVNVALFDRLRSQQERPLASSVRAVLLLTINYAQLAVCFGLLYSTMLWNLKGANSWIDAFYFSAITQLTVGYGDVAPMHSAKWFAVLQAGTGTIFLVVVLATMIGLVPSRPEMLGQHKIIDRSSEGRDDGVEP